MTPQKVSPEYRAWLNMRARCKNPNARGFADYGGRGIWVDKRWDSFERFFSDMGPRPSPEHTLERKDNNGPYAKTNCRWATRREQARNRRSSLRIKYDGREQIAAEWIRELGINGNVFYQRVHKGWDPLHALLRGIERRDHHRRVARFKLP